MADFFRKEFSERFGNDKYEIAANNGFSKELMSEFLEHDVIFVDIVLGSKFSVSSIEQIFKEYVNKRISWQDMQLILEYSTYSRANEVYIPEFIESLDSIHHSTAARCLICTILEELAYSKVVELVLSEYFIPTIYGRLDVSMNLWDSLLSLNGHVSMYREYGDPYTTDRIDWSEMKDSHITCEDKEFVLKITELYHERFWQDFIVCIDVVKERFNLTPSVETLYTLYWRFVPLKKPIGYDNNLRKEYKTFLDVLRGHSPESIIDAAYEIVIKSEIIDYFKEHYNEFEFDQVNYVNYHYNPLNRIYNVWKNDRTIQRKRNFKRAIEVALVTNSDDAFSEDEVAF